MVSIYVITQLILFSLPVKMDGTTCGFILCYLTDDELGTYIRVLLSDGNYWYPSKDIFDISSIQ